jgi:hypothetical protein
VIQPPSDWQIRLAAIRLPKNWATGFWASAKLAADNGLTPCRMVARRCQVVKNLDTPLLMVLEQSRACRDERNFSPNNYAGYPRTAELARPFASVFRIYTFDSELRGGSFQKKGDQIEKAVTLVTL